MTRERAKELLPIIQAFAEGKSVQYSNRKDSWKDCDTSSLILFGDCDYRIKPEPKYRSFKSREECWNEMLKHQPFGWVRGKNSKIPYNIIKIDDCYISTILHAERSFRNSFLEYVFVDGTPFGIKEE